MGIVDQSPGDRDSLHLAAGHLVGLLVGLVLKADFVERIECQLPALVGGDAADGQRQLHVLQHCLVGDQVVRLEDKAHRVVAVGVPISVLVFLRGDAVDDQVTRIVPVQSSDDVEKGRLTRAAGP